MANGNQIFKVNPLVENNAQAELDKDLADEKFEPDTNKTPRITGAIFENENGASAALHIARSDGDMSVTSVWEVPLESGHGKYIATYAGSDGSPTPLFAGEPLEITLDFGSPEAAAREIYKMLTPPPSEPDYRISVMAVYKKMGEAPRIKIVNKNANKN